MRVLPHLVLLTWSPTNQTPQHRSHDRALNRLMHTLVRIIWIMHTFQRPTVVSGKWVALNYLSTSFVCITGLISALGQCSNGLERIMHTQLVFKYYLMINGPILLYATFLPLLRSSRSCGQSWTSCLMVGKLRGLQEREGRVERARQWSTSHSRENLRSSARESKLKIV